MSRHALLVALALLASGAAGAHEGDARAHYLANEGVMATHGERKILFDPLFNESFGQYQLLPEAMRADLFAGRPPWDGIDAVFISHYHDDHFAPTDMRDFLRANQDTQLYAPGQAVAALRDVTPATDEILGRVTAVRLDTGDGPEFLRAPGLLIEAVRIPHSGWPTRHVEVENIAWRVTLDDAVTVIHLGDADTRDVHFAPFAAHWDERTAQLALPPYWYFQSTNGRQVLEQRLRPDHAIGIHVPVSVPADPNQRDEGLRDVDLFTQPGETRLVPHSHPRTSSQASSQDTQN